MLGQCVNSAPVAFLRNFEVKCVNRLRSCPTGPPLQTLSTDLKVKVKNGQGGMFYLLNICFDDDDMFCSSLNPCVFILFIYVSMYSR